MERDSNNNICLIKKKGKVKALDEELYSKTDLVLITFTFTLMQLADAFSQSHLRKRIRRTCSQIVTLMRYPWPQQRALCWPILFNM